MARQKFTDQGEVAHRVAMTGGTPVESSKSNERVRENRGDRYRRRTRGSGFLSLLLGCRVRGERELRE